MVVLTNPEQEHISLVKVQKPNCFFPGIPIIDLGDPESRARLVTACEELGFFKVVNHGVPMEAMARLESEAMRFFSRTQDEKENAGAAVGQSPLGYGSKRIGANGDVGWVEYLLMQVIPSCHDDTQKTDLLATIDEYIRAVRRLARELLEMIADGLAMEQRDTFSRMVMSDDSDSMFRLNHYPPCPAPKQGGVAAQDGSFFTGFGEHTDPQLISLLRSNDTNGLQISLRDGSWVSVHPDSTCLFVNVGDALQVLTNGRFRSVRHRVLANSHKSRVSMIYFAGPPSGERLAPLPLLMRGGEESRYREFTWFEYKRCAYKSRLADDRLVQFEK